MGMFDYVRCDYPLPDGAPREDYQTKDTPMPCCETYTIAADGRLLDPAGRPVAFHGALTFATSNVCGTSGAGYLTTDGARAVFWEFVALYDHGRLLQMEGGVQPPSAFYDRAPLTVAAFWGRGTAGGAAPAGDSDA